jgi:hypothetical protein
LISLTLALALSLAVALAFFLALALSLAFALAIALGLALVVALAIVIAFSRALALALALALAIAIALPLVFSLVLAFVLALAHALAIVNFYCTQLFLALSLAYPRCCIALVRVKSSWSCFRLFFLLLLFSFTVTTAPVFFRFFSITFSIYVDLFLLLTFLDNFDAFVLPLGFLPDVSL